MALCPAPPVYRVRSQTPARRKAHLQSDKGAGGLIAEVRPHKALSHFPPFRERRVTPCSPFLQCGRISTVRLRQDTQKQPCPKTGIRQPRYLSGIHQLLPLQGQTPRRSAETPENRVRPVLHTVTYRQYPLRSRFSNFSRDISRFTVYFSLKMSNFAI